MVALRICSLSGPWLSCIELMPILRCSICRRLTCYRTGSRLWWFWRELWSRRARRLRLDRAIWIRRFCGVIVSIPSSVTIKINKVSRLITRSSTRPFRWTPRCVRPRNCRTISCTRKSTEHQVCSHSSILSNAICVVPSQCLMYLSIIAVNNQLIMQVNPIDDNEIPQKEQSS